MFGQLQFKMQQRFLKNQRNKYNQNFYSEWSQLPPNLPLPKAEQIQAFELRFIKVIYLNQINSQLPLQLTIQWWGMDKPHVVLFSSHEDGNKMLKYVICSPLEGLFSYFNDTKIASIDVQVKGRTIGKAYLNFLVLKGWKGELLDGFIDIKQSKKKIGEISYSIQIKKTSNPFLTISDEPQNKHQKHIKRPTILRESKNSSINSPSCLGRNSQGEDRVLEDSNNYRNKHQHNHHHHQRERQSQISQHEKIPKYIDSQEHRVWPRRRQYNFREQQEQYQHIFMNHNTNHYDTQMVRLVEDYNILFQQHKNLDLLKTNTENTIQLQIVKLQLSSKDQPSQINVNFPLINNHINQYKIEVGGFIKVNIDARADKNQLVNYLKHCNLQFNCLSKYEGTIALSKVLTQTGEVIQVVLFEKEKGGKKLKQKGICFIKAIPPVQDKGDQGQQKKQEENEQKKQEIENKVEKPIFFVLLSIKKYNPLQKLNRKMNLLVKVIERENQKPIGQTKTLWNSQENLNIQDSVTCQTTNSTLFLQLLDRQKSDIKLGQGALVLQNPIGINVQVPISTSHMGRVFIIGYITLDFVKNGLNSVTKMINIFSRSQNEPLLPYNGEKQPQNYNKEHDINTIEQKKRQEQQRKRREDQEEQQKGEMQIKTVVKDYIETHIESSNKKHKQIIFERQLSQLQTYNKLFTHLHQNQQLMQPLADKNSIKITQFLDLFQSITKQHILTLKELNFIISKHIFNPKQTSFVNMINCGQFRDSYDAFCTYYENLVEQRDGILKQLLQVLNNVGLSVNDLEYQLKNNKKMWEKLNQFLSYGKGEKINIVEAIREHYETSPVPITQGTTKKVTGAQFCDILRKFQIYETTLGQEIREGKLSTSIYEQICELLVDIEPYIANYTYKELIKLLRDEQIVLSQWEMLNLQEHLKMKPKIRGQSRNFSAVREQELYSTDKGRNKGYKYCQFQKQTRPKIYDIPRQTKPFFRQYQHQETVKQNISELNNKPTITKSPTFGHLHAPQLFQHQNGENMMVESLADRIHSLPISPINYHNSQEATRHLRAVFSNLKYKPTSLSIDNQLINLTQLNIQNYYSKQSNPANQPSQTQKYESNKQSLPQHSGQVNNTVKSIDEPSHNKEYQSYKSNNRSNNIEISLSQLEKQFSYNVEIVFEEEASPVFLQCLYEEWCSIVSEEGDYLGGLLIL